MLSGIYLQGEIADFKLHRPSGHMYFTIKDDTSRMRGVMFAGNASRLKFTPYNGMNAIFMGSVSVYEKSGEYQLYVTDIVPDGIGAQFIAAEELKRKLSAEGLFDERFKKPIPKFPKKIAAVTAVNGAALKDIINVLSRRCPYVELNVFGSLVQGTDAPKTIVSALQKADASGCDVIICGRGGGSSEDLNCFNDESVARAVFACNTPVISAVGHEIDTTVIDFVADLRAPTPSAAAELASSELADIYEMASASSDALLGAFANLLKTKAEAVQARKHALERLSPDMRIAALIEKAKMYEKLLQKAADGLIERKTAALSARAAGIDAVNPLSVLSRGYSLVYEEDKLIRSANDTASGSKIRLVFADGERTAVME